MTDTKTNTDIESPIGKKFIGCVKWFDNKRSYGFITTISNENKEHEDKKPLDIFVHHTALSIENNMYRYLVQGEYVEFECVETLKDNYKWQAKNVTGIQGGKLMCETRSEIRGDNKVRSNRSQKQNKDGYQTIVKGRQHT